MQIASIRRHASRASATLERNKAAPDGDWKNLVREDVEAFDLVLRRALHDGIVGQHPAFWHAIVLKTIESVSEDARLIRMIVEQSTLVAQIRFLNNETLAAVSNPRPSHNRLALARAFCAAFKHVNHPRL